MIALFVAFAPATKGQVQTIIYVDGSNTTSTTNGDDWSTAYTSLNDALSDSDATGATASDTEIWIAEGTYTPGANPGDSFTITGAQDGLTIYGGFASGDDFTDRDPQAHEVILSGDIGTIGATSDNSYHVLVFDGGNAIGSDVTGNVTSATVLDGVTVSGGHADGSAPEDNGGGLFCDGQGAGNNCSPTLRGVVFDENNATSSGGAIYNMGYGNGKSSPTITNSTFTGNSASDSGGAIFNRGQQNGASNPTITDTRFADNSAEGFGGAIYNFANGGESSPEITGAVFTGNSADVDGGALYNYGFDGESSPHIKETVFTGNSASVGGGMYVVGNGAIGALVVNSTFVGNGSDHIGLDGASTSKELRFINCTFTGAQSQVLTVDAFDDSKETPFHVSNSILWNNGGNLTTDDQALKVTYSLVGQSSYAEGNEDGAPGNVHATPQFSGGTSLRGPDDVLTTADDSLALTQGSPALDAGSNDSLDSDNDGTREIDTDITGAPRVRDNDNDTGTPAVVDMGAYEAPASVQLPVQIARVEVTQSEGRSAVLRWTTTAETNNAGFHVQHSDSSAASWTNIGFRKGGGTTTTTHSYRFTAEDLSVGTHRFRLKQVDLDGSTHLHDPVTVDLQMTKALRLAAPAPNPVQGTATASFAVKEQVQTTVALYNVLGKQVATVYQGTPTAGEAQTLRIGTSDLASGVYFLRLQADGQSRTQRLTIVR